jgi:hypothetical protein
MNCSSNQCQTTLSYAARIERAQTTKRFDGIKQGVAWSLFLSADIWNFGKRNRAGIIGSDFNFD